MPRHVRVAVLLAVWPVCVPAVDGEETTEICPPSVSPLLLKTGVEAPPPAAPKAKVEIRWVEGERVEGLTAEEGFQSSCDPDSIVYPHKEPALVLTVAEVVEARLTEHDFRSSGLSIVYMVELHLTNEAREALAATCAGNETRMLTIMIDGRHWGVHRYEKDKNMPFVPEQAQAESFRPSVGFFSSRAEAERLVDALK